MKRKTEIALLYFSKHFRKKIKLEEIAKIAGISPFYFHRIFVEENNCTPHNYLEDIRMRHATHIMEMYPNWSLMDVAFDCGYSSPSTFSRAFKKYHGVAPSKYVSPNDNIPNNIQLEKIKDFQIQYLSKKTFAVKKVPLLNHKLNLACQALIDDAPSDATLFGFILDAPFHVPIEQCRYFIGGEYVPIKKTSSILTMPAGYYTSIIVQGDFDTLLEIVSSKNQQINNKGYVIDSLIGYEKIVIPHKTKEFDYIKSTREIFIKIKRE